MAYLIYRYTGSGVKEYVAYPGSKNSYTRLRENAQEFPTLNAAQRECCGNERIEAKE